MEVWRLVERLARMPASKDINLLQLMRLYRAWDAEDQQHPDLDQILRQREDRIQECLECGDLDGLRGYLEDLRGGAPTAGRTVRPGCSGEG